MPYEILLDQDIIRSELPLSAQFRCQEDSHLYVP